jgi:hypothetical protein
LESLITAVAPYLSVGGDAAIIAAFIFLWRMDRRLVRLELKAGLTDKLIDQTLNSFSQLIKERS